MQRIYTNLVVNILNLLIIGINTNFNKILFSWQNIYVSVSMKGNVEVPYPPNALVHTVLPVCQFQLKKRKYAPELDIKVLISRFSTTLKTQGSHNAASANPSR